MNTRKGRKVVARSLDGAMYPVVVVERALQAVSRWRRRRLNTRAVHEMEVHTRRHVMGRRMLAAWENLSAVDKIAAESLPALWSVYRYFDAAKRRLYRHIESDCPAAQRVEAPMDEEAARAFDVLVSP